MKLEAAQSILSSLPCGILLLDTDKTIRWINPQLCNWLEIESSELIGKSQADLGANLKDIIFPSGPINCFAQKNGQKIWLKKHSTDIDQGISLYFEDITEKCELQIALSEARTNQTMEPMHDPITGLLNQTALMIALEPQVSRSRRYNNPISALVISLQSIPTEALTDATLRQIGQILKIQLRWADLIGRASNGDFIVILPETKAEDAQQIADKLEVQLADTTHLAEEDLGSIGVVEWQKTDTAALLIQRAAEARREIKAAS